MTILQHSIAQAAAAAGGYQIARSLRFNSADSAYLSRTPASASNRKTWTWSANIKRSALDTEQFLFDCSLSLNETSISFSTGNTLVIYAAVAGSVVVNLITTQVFRDVGAHMNIQLTVDTTQATASNRLKLYINGVQVTAFSTATYCAQNTDLIINTNNAHSIGRNTNGANRYASMYFSDMRLIDGQALDPTSFGEFDANTGVWNPKTYSGTYGTNGFWLKFDDNSGVTSTTLGKDSSGNSNNWTPNNFSVTAGVGNDSLVDTPTNYGTDTGVGGEVRGNYATFNPLVAAGGTHTNGNLDYTAADNGLTTPTTIFPSSGKWYCEIVWNSGANPRIGVTNTSGIGSNLGSSTNSWANLYDGRLYYNSTVTSYGVGISTGDVVMMALDIDAGKLWYGKNGTWMASGNPSTGANPSQTFTANQSMSFAVSSGGGTPNWTGNFGQRAFAYTAPSGFKALCTQNLPTPAIGATSSTLANKNFDVSLYTGTGTTAQNVTNSGAFKPDLVWIKSRSNTFWHELYDGNRGVNKPLYSNGTNAEASYTGMTAFLSNGFTVQDNGTTNQGTNAPSATFTAWQWKGANTTVSNTDGSRTSTVSANPAAGISIASFSTVTSGTSSTVGHGLGVVPKMIITKYRNAANNWVVHHASLGTGYTLQLNTTSAQLTNTTNIIATSSSTFTLGTSFVDNPTQPVIAYCFAEVPGFSKFGSYTGNGSADGPFVYCGFRPRYVMVKRTDAVSNWSVYDTARDTYNDSSALLLYPNLSNAETAIARDIDILSNGFKCRSNDSDTNTLNGTYIFAAFAEAPFNYARAR